MLRLLLTLLHVLVLLLVIAVKSVVGLLVLGAVATHMAAQLRATVAVFTPHP